MSEEDIADTIAAFATASADAKRLGFDVVELHGAHGYLIDQFFWEATNERTDRYGGATLKERARFAAEIVAATRAALGPDMPLILRLSQWKQQDYKVKLATTPNEMEDWLLPLKEAGVDIFHCSQRRFWEPEFPEIDGEEGLNFAGWAKKLTGAATISVGSVGLSGEFLAAFGGQTSSPVGLDGADQAYGGRGVRSDRRRSRHSRRPALGDQDQDRRDREPEEFRPGFARRTGLRQAPPLEPRFRRRRFCRYGTHADGACAPRTVEAPGTGP